VTTVFPSSLPASVQEQLDRGQAAELAARREEARACYEAALRLLPRGEATTASGILRRIARTHDADGDPSAALDVSEAAIAVAETTGDDYTLASALNTRAAVFYQLGDLDECERLFTESRILASRCGSDRLLAMIEQNLAAIACIRGDLHLALVQYRSSLDHYRRLGLDGYVGPLLNNIGKVCTELGDFEAAEKAFREARRHLRKAGDRTHEVLVEVNRARLFVQKREFDQAQEVCMDALALAQSTGEERWTAELWRNQGVIERERGAFEAAHRILSEARSLSEERQDGVLTADIVREQAALFRAMGRNQDTLRALNDARHMFEQLRARRELADLGRRLQDLETEFLEIVREWGTSIERKDAYTQGHCDRVADYACRLAVVAGMGEQDLKWFRMGALLHDVGKVSVPEEILTKAGKLDDAEWAIMSRHPVTGVELLEGVEFPWDVRPMIRHHHEKWDGRGYPDKLRGDDIPFAARILTVADVWDALTTTRSYRPAFTAAEAFRIMEKESGTTFDPDLLPLFAQVLAQPDLRGQERAAA
jgi:putative nucleotidyltransferase with HDIG domain